MAREIAAGGAFAMQVQSTSVSRFQSPGAAIFARPVLILREIRG
jgi:hypothetical protein